MNKNILSIASILIFNLIVISCSKDSNDPDPIETPIIVTTEDFFITIDENPENGQSIGFVQGSTNEGNVTFSIIDQTPAGAFSIDAASGELTVANESLFKFETHPIITGTIKVANGNVFENAMVTINLNEVIVGNIYNGDVVLYTQEEVDAFGANNYTHITKNLVIGSIGDPLTEILTLSSLSSLKSVGSHVTIMRNGLLESLDGLENLETIGYYLSIQNNPSLNSIAALSKITAVEGFLSIERNNSLINLNGLENLTEIRGSLSIQSNHNLVNITSLSNVSHVGLDLNIMFNNKLESIELNSLTSVPRKLWILHNLALTNLDGISNLNSIGGDLVIQRNTLLSDFCGLSNVFMGGYFNGLYIVSSNNYDPTEQDLIDGNCRL